MKKLNSVAIVVHYITLKARSSFTDIEIYKHCIKDYFDHISGFYYFYYDYNKLSLSERTPESIQTLSMSNPDFIY